MILGVADRVPVDAEFARLQALPGLLLRRGAHGVVFVGGLRPEARA